MEKKKEVLKKYKKAQGFVLIATAFYFGLKCMVFLWDIAMPVPIRIIISGINKILPLAILTGCAVCIHCYLDIEVPPKQDMLKGGGKICVGIAVMLLFGVGAFYSALWSVRYIIEYWRFLGRLYGCAASNVLVAGGWLFCWCYGFQKRRLIGTLRDGGGGLSISILILIAMMAISATIMWFTVGKVVDILIVA